MKIRFAAAMVIAVACMGAGPCLQGALTSEEARQALEEVTLSSQALTLASGTVEIATNFTIGEAVEAAAKELGVFIEEQLPCAEITLIDATLSIEYGARPGNCYYNGREYSGKHEITVTSAKLGELEVEHVWDELSDGQVTVSGTAQVTWSSVESSRNVVHELTWTRISDGDEVVGGGDRTQTLLEGGLIEGIKVDGERDWTSASGDWVLDIDDVEVRWVDPIPQSGSYTLDTPFDKEVSFSFERIDDNRIRVTVESGMRSFEFDVTRLGAIS